MIDTLRAQLKDIIGQASHVDGLITDAGQLPDIEAAKALVELEWLNTRLERLAGRLAPFGDGDGPMGGKGGLKRS